MFGNRWWGLLAVLLAVGLALRNRAFLLFVFLLAIASGASVLWSRYCLHAIAYRRRLRDDRIFYGEETELAIEVTNAKPLPLAWLLVRDRFPQNVSLLTGDLETEEEAEQSERQPIRSVTYLLDMIALRWYERVRRTYRIRGDCRGLFCFGPVSLASGDLFGFERKAATYPGQTNLVVYPRVVPIDRLGLPAEYPSGEEKARRKIIEDPLRMASVREYAPGDSIRHIHWKNTARLGQLQTKVFDPASSQVLVIFVDLQTAHNPYSLVSEYLELAITSAASIAIDALDRRYAVGLYANGGPRSACHWTVVPPGRSTYQATRILDSLAPLFGFRLIPLYHLLRRSMPTLPFGSTVLAISANVTEALCVSLLSLQDAGHPVKLLTIGDERPGVPHAFASYHLGGRHAWQRLETLELA